ncbi:MAG: hypothetical protein K0S78_1646 [Thermomicrobiales bacterium]|jgi:hypothetical protein|nr:hypothetical protein [Thermomicrobiales bacterium]
MSATMESTPKTEWHLVGEDIVLCNCAWGCPCQFNALPTYGLCEAMAVLDIERGRFGDTPLDGVRYAHVFHWDGPVHEGNGWRRVIHDERSTPTQRAAIEALTDGTQGHAYFEIFSAMAPNVLEPAVAPIELEYDHEKRVVRLRIGEIAEAQVEPIRNPVTGEEHRARIDLPNGFEYRVAEQGNAVRWRTDAGEHLAMEHENSYAHMARVEWSSAGTVR